MKEDASFDVRKKAVFGISQSRETGAIDTLIDTARSNDQASVRGEAIFWLSQKAGQKAAAAITERIEQDPDTEVKKRAVFALARTRILPSRSRQCSGWDSRRTRALWTSSPKS